MASTVFYCRLSARLEGPSVPRYLSSCAGGRGSGGPDHVTRCLSKDVSMHPGREFPPSLGAARGVFAYTIVDGLVTKSQYVSMPEGVGTVRACRGKLTKALTKLNYECQDPETVGGLLYFPKCKVVISLERGFHLESSDLYHQYLERMWMVCRWRLPPDRSAHRTPMVVRVISSSDLGF